jgi:hypothetical protein
MAEPQDAEAARKAVEEALDEDRVREAAEAAVERVLDLGQVRPSAETPEPYLYLREKALILDRELKKKYATWLCWLLSAQLALADTVFVVYAWAGKHWRLDGPVIEIWLGATVVQVVGVVLVVTRHLFPQRDQKI